MHEGLVIVGNRDGVDVVAVVPIDGPTRRQRRLVNVAQRDGDLFHPAGVSDFIINGGDKQRNLADSRVNGEDAGIRIKGAGSGNTRSNRKGDIIFRVPIIQGRNANPETYLLVGSRNLLRWHGTDDIDHHLPAGHVFGIFRDVRGRIRKTYEIVAGRNFNGVGVLPLPDLPSARKALRADGKGNLFLQLDNIVVIDVQAHCGRLTPFGNIFRNGIRADG